MYFKTVHVCFSVRVCVCVCVRDARGSFQGPDVFACGYVWLACCGFAFAWQDGLTGSAWGDWANYTASPLRAFENELGVQPPLGFWDPLGFTADGDVNFFERRRQSEIKHGRIAMLATMGYITPEPLSCTKRFRIAFGRGSNYSTAFQGCRIDVHMLTLTWLST